MKMVCIGGTNDGREVDIDKSLARAALIRLPQLRPYPSIGRIADVEALNTEKLPFDEYQIIHLGDGPECYLLSVKLSQRDAMLRLLAAYARLKRYE